MIEHADIAIVGVGAAGLMAGIWAGRTRPGARIVALDGAAKLGAKILVAGGGRCNVTHDEVHEREYAGSTRPAIKKVLRRFDVSATVAFFEALGVRLKREDTGKLFPVTDSARTVLDALLGASAAAGVDLRHPRRVDAVERRGDGFVVSGDWGALAADRVILATGGRSLPKSGSDGGGYALAAALGHNLTPRIFPALVPLTLPNGHFLTTLSGISTRATLEVRTVLDAKPRARFTGSLLCTHFGLSGPVALDISRYYLNAAEDDPEAALTVNWLPDETPEVVDAALQILQSQGRGIARALLGNLPERLGRALLAEAGLPAGATAATLIRESRARLVTVLTRLPLPITGNRGFTYAEVTAGGVPLSELVLTTMESRACPGLYLCGEICDVDGRIGGYNFQWAWASGFVAGCAAAQPASA
jgi:hypothetical protein